MNKSWMLLPVLLSAGCALLPIGVSTKLEPKVLAITEQKTNSTPITVKLTWNDVLNAKSFEIVKQNPDGAKNDVFTTDKKEYSDTDVAAGKAYTYTIRAMDGNNMQLTVASPLTVTPLAGNLEKPTLPNATLQVDSAQPDLTWNATPGASWYFISVKDRADNQQIYGAFADKTTWKLGTASYNKNLNLPGFTQVQNIGLKRGSSYSWTVTAIKADTDTLESAKAVVERSSDEGIVIY